MLKSAGRQDAVPMAVLWFLLLSLAAQLLWHHQQGLRAARIHSLPTPPPLEVLQAASLGDPNALSKLTTLWLQSFDNQPGVSIPFARLDYELLREWLSLVLKLDPNTAYPLLLASRVYGEVADPDRQRIMLEFVAAEFLRAPNARWPWLAHAVYVAQHRLGDLDLALRYAELLATHAVGENVPHWAQQMRIFVLERMGEIESARVLLGGLLASGEITDPHERRFLMQRLRDLGDD